MNHKPLISQGTFLIAFLFSHVQQPFQSADTKRRRHTLKPDSYFSDEDASDWQTENNPSSFLLSGVYFIFSSKNVVLKDLILQQYMVWVWG